MCKNKYEKTVVIFLDILGSREMKSFEQKYNIHKIFHSEIKENQALQDTEAKANVAYTRKLYSFSDCAYILYKYKDGIEEERKDADKLMRVALFNTSHIVVALLNAGYLARGGVTYGDAYFDELSFFGPAIEEAYLLESTMAKYPRILIETEFAESVYRLEKETYKDIYSDNNPMFKFLPQRSYIPTIVKKYDSEFILNIFYLLEMEGTDTVGGNIITHQELKDNILTNIDVQLSINTQKIAVLEKLNWMKKFTGNSCLSLVNEPNGVTFTI
jgi:hypothetical protein